MWSPTHVEVTVSRARNLKAKGKSGTNDAYVTIKLGKEKFQTTLRERAKDPEWHEQCQFPLSKEHELIKLKVFHRNLIGKDDFLGYAEIKLDPSLVYERPKSRWYNLGNRPDDKRPAQNRGEIEVFVTYVVESISGSHMSLNMMGKGRTLPSFKGIAHQFGDKLSLKGSLKRSPSQKSDSKSDLRNLDSGLEQSGGMMPPHQRRAIDRFDSREDEKVAGLLEEENEAEVDLQTLRDKKPRATRSSAFKFPFRSKNRQLQKMSLLSQSTLGLPSMKAPTSEFGPMHDVTSPPSESSSGFESRRVSTSESQASSVGDSSTQIKESDDPVSSPDATLTFQDIKQGSSQSTLSWENGDSGDLKPELKEKNDDVPDIVASICAEKVSVAKEMEAFDLGGKGLPLLDVQEELFSTAENEKIPESPERRNLEIGATCTAAEMVSLVSDWDYMEEKIQEQENFTVVATSDVSLDTTITTKSLSPRHESVSLLSESTDHGPKPIIAESVSTDLKQPSVDLKSKSTDLKLESSAYESESVNLLAESKEVMSELIDQKSESVDLNSESTGAVPESFIIKHSSPFSGPDSANLMPRTMNFISQLSDCKSESFEILPEPVETNLTSESIFLFPKPVISDHDSTFLKTKPDILAPESSNNNLGSASSEQEFLTAKEKTSLDLEVDVDLEDKRCADEADVPADQNNSDVTPSGGGHAEPAVSDSQTKTTSERDELIGITESSSQSTMVEEMEQAEQDETPSSPKLLLPEAVLRQFRNYSRDDLIQIVLDQQRQLQEKNAHIHDLENYIDNLLVKVIDIQPRILSANEKCTLGGATSGPRPVSQAAEKSSLASQPRNVPTPKVTETETYVAYRKVTSETVGSAHVTVVTSPKPAATKQPGFLNILKAKK